MRSHLASVVLVTNPRAGGGAGEAAAQAAAATLDALGVASVIERTQGPGDAAPLARAAAERGATLVVAVGGDGTLHEVVDGIMSGPRRPVVGVVPVGGGNDFARMIGVSGLAPHLAARALVDGDPRPADIGILEGGDRGAERFVNNIGVGFAAWANIGREKARRLGGLSYLVGGVASLITFRPDAHVVTVDDVSVEGRFVLCHIANGRFCGKGIDFTPHARLDDGLLDVAIVAERTKLRATLEWPWITRGAMREDVGFLRGRRVRVLGPRGFLLHVDGEVRRVPAGALEVRLEPGALSIVHAPGARAPAAAPREVAAV